MDRKYLFFLLISSFALVWLFGRQLNRPICINSKVVKSIVIEESDSKGLISVPSCLVGGSKVYKNDVTVNSFQVLKVIQSFPAIESIFTGSISPIKVVLASNSDKLMITPSFVLLPLSLYEADPEILLKSVISSLVEQKYSQVGAFHRSILEDFFISVLKHELSVVGKVPESHTFIGSNYLLSLQDYCKSKWQSLAHRQYCLRQNKYLKKNNMQDLHSITSWSFRPMIVGQLFNSYKKMNAIEALFWSKNLNHSAIKNKLLASSLPPVVLPSRQLKSTLKRLTTDYAEIFAFKSQKLNIKPKQKLTFLDLEEHEGYIKSNLTRFKVASNIADLDFSSEESLVFSCARRQLKKILAEKKSRWIVLIKLCRKQDIDWEGVFTGNTKKFLADNKQLSFYLFHGPSLSLAQKHFNNVLRFSDQKVNSKLLGSLFEWGVENEKNSAHIIRPQSVIEAVHSYREI